MKDKFCSGFRHDYWEKWMNKKAYLLEEIEQYESEVASIKTKLNNHRL